MRTLSRRFAADRWALRPEVEDPIERREVVRHERGRARCTRLGGRLGRQRPLALALVLLEQAHLDLAPRRKRGDRVEQARDRHPRSRSSCI